jgi:predicted membrane protein
LSAALGVASYFSITIGWYRMTGSQIGLTKYADRLPNINLPRVPLTVFLYAISLVLGVTALIVAAHINVLEFNDFVAASADAILPWDPTRTARKYLVLAFILAASSFAWSRFGHRRHSISVLPALMLVIAIPAGAVGYEMRSNYWSYSYWIEKGLDGREEMLEDPYLYLGEPQSENTIAIRVRNDMIQLLQLAERSGMGSAPDHWEGLRELEREVRQRRRTGLAFLIIAGGVLGGGIFILRKERNTA